MAGVGPVGEGEGGRVFVVGVGQAEGGALLGCTVVGAGLAEFAEGGGVAAGLGGEVAAEAEHVSPVAELAVGVEGVEVQACGDEPGGVGWSAMPRSTRASLLPIRRSTVPVVSAALVAYLAT